MSQHGPQVTYMAADPVITYGPTVDVDPRVGNGAGWQTNFSGGIQLTQDGSFSQSAKEGLGIVARSASAVGSFVEFKFYGSSVTVHGTAKDMFYGVTLDGSPAQQVITNDDSDVLVNMSDLAIGWHNLTIKVIANQSDTAVITVMQVVFDTGMQGVPTTGAIESTESSSWNLQPKDSWKRGSGAFPTSLMTSSAAAKATLSQGLSASVMLLRGNIHPGNWLYQVDIDAGNDSSADRYNGTSEFVIKNVVLWVGILPTRPADIMFALENVNSLGLDFTRLEFISIDPSSAQASHKKTIGIAVGGSLCALFLVLLLGWVLLVCWTRRRRRGAQYHPHLSAKSTRDTKSQTRPQTNSSTALLDNEWKPTGSVVITPMREIDPFASLSDPTTNVGVRVPTPPPTVKRPGTRGKLVLVTERKAWPHAPTVSSSEYPRSVPRTPQSPTTTYVASTSRRRSLQSVEVPVFLAS